MILLYPTKTVFILLKTDHFSEMAPWFWSWFWSKQWYICKATLLAQRDLSKSYIGSTLFLYMIFGVLVLLLFTAQFAQSGTNYVFLINILRLFLFLQRLPGFSLPAVRMEGVPLPAEILLIPPYLEKFPPVDSPIRFLLPPTPRLNYLH